MPLRSLALGPRGSLTVATVCLITSVQSYLGKCRLDPATLSCKYCLDLDQALISTFCQGLDSKYFSLCSPRGLCCSYSVVLLKLGNSLRHYVDEQAWLCSIKTVFTRTSSRFGRGAVFTHQPVYFWHGLCVHFIILAT